MITVDLDDESEYIMLLTPEGEVVGFKIGLGEYTTLVHVGESIGISIDEEDILKFFLDTSFEKGCVKHRLDADDFTYGWESNELIFMLEPKTVN